MTRKRRTVRERWRWLSRSGSSMNPPRECKVQGRWKSCDNTESRDLGMNRSHVHTGHKLWCGLLVKSFADEVACGLRAVWYVKAPEKPHSHPLMGPPTAVLCSRLKPRILPVASAHPRARPEFLCSNISHVAQPCTVVPWPGVLPSLSPHSSSLAGTSAKSC